jgi:hypothetical protein
MDTMTKRNPGTFVFTLISKSLARDCTNKVQPCRTYEYIHTWQWQSALCAASEDYCYLLLPPDSHFDFQTGWMHHPAVRGSAASYAQHCCPLCLVEIHRPALLPQPDCLHSDPTYLNQNVHHIQNNKNSHEEYMMHTFFTNKFHLKEKLVQLTN